MTEQTTPSWRDRFFARCWSHLAGGIDQVFQHHKDQVLVDLPDRIVEIGPGLGSNFGRYAAGTQVTAFEPNLAMHQGLREAAAAAGIEIEIRSDDLREAQLDTGSVRAVVSTLVLCSVGDQASMVAEIYRILEPGGRFLFVEHVASEQPRIRRWQRAIRWPWGLIGDGCDPAPHTVEAIEDAGFSEVRAERDIVGSKLNPAHPVYWGTAIR